MKISLLDMEKLISVNRLKEVTNSGMWSNNKTMYHPGGILSNEIFGISKNDRRGKFAFIDLTRPFLHPHIYGNVLKGMFRDIVDIVSGKRKFVVVNGKLTRAEDGWTGLNSLYEHWDSIDWNKSNSRNERSLKLLSKLGRDEVFVTKWPVCPPAYRDVMITGTVDTSDHVNELNELYTKLIRYVSILQEGGVLLRHRYNSQVKIQDTLMEISDYCKGQIAKKHGLIRHYLIGKTVDYGTRAVISAFNYNNETIHENMVSINHTALPIAQCCSTFFPFIEAWLKNFFTNEVINNPGLIGFYDLKTKKMISAVMKDPEVQFSDKVIERMIKDYVFNPDNRFKPITVNATILGHDEDRDIQACMILEGKRILPNNVETVLNRAMTVTDALYLACVETCEKRHVMVTRYPVGTDKGLFMNKIRVQSTRNHIKLIYNGKEYPHYPDIDFDIPNDQVGVQFVDTAVFSNSLLDGLGGDLTSKVRVP